MIWRFFWLYKEVFKLLVLVYSGLSHTELGSLSLWINVCQQTFQILEQSDQPISDCVRILQEQNVGWTPGMLTKENEQNLLFEKS